MKRVRRIKETLLLLIGLYTIISMSEEKLVSNFKINITEKNAVFDGKDANVEKKTIHH